MVFVTPDLCPFPTIPNMHVVENIMDDAMWERENYCFMALQQLRSLAPGCGREITRCMQFKVIPRTTMQCWTALSVQCVGQ